MRELIADERFTPKCRDAVAKYCTALAVIAELRAELATGRRVDRAAVRKELRSWLLATRLIENDLLLTPASALRAPQQAGHDSTDPFAEFDPDPIT